MPRVPDAYIRARADEILAAATRCFARAGYRGVSMGDVATEAGLSVGALYRYFNGKEHLFSALAARARQGTCAARSAGTSPEQRLVAFIDGYFDALSDPGSRESLALDIRFRSEALDSDFIRKEIEAAYRERISVLQTILCEGGTRSAERFEAGALAIIGILNEAGLQHALGPGFNANALRAAAKTAAKALLRSEVDE